MTDTRADPQATTPAPPNRRAITWWWIAAIFVVAVVIAALAIIFLTPQNQGTQPQQPPGLPGGCQLAQGSQDVPTTTPADIEWRVTAGKTLLPFSATSGPVRVQGPVASCYSQDPVGALLAASQIYGRVLGPNADESVQVLKAQATPGPERDRFVESLSNPTTPPEQIQWRAFKYLSYTADAAKIDLVLESTATGTVVGVPLTVVWQDGDWKWDFASFSPTETHLINEADLTTYAPWSGIR